MLRAPDALENLGTQGKDDSKPELLRGNLWRVPLTQDENNLGALWIRAASLTNHVHNPNCSMASLPVSNSAEMMPMAANMAKRPLLSSRCLISVLYWPRPAGSPKLPGSLDGSSVQKPNSSAPATRKRATKP
uniref:Uncharacterized protein n=1 Tax=Spumella elongata TaxID=89044 RepID=A0A7S3HIH6_9STRA